MQKFITGMVVISIVLSFVVSFSVARPEDAQLTINGRTVLLDHDVKASLGFVDGLKNGTIILGSGLRYAVADAAGSFQSGFGQETVFGSSLLRRVWWLIGIPVSLFRGLFACVIYIGRMFIYVAFSIKGGFWYYVGFALPIVLLLAAGKAGEGYESEPTGEDETPTNVI